MARVLIVDGDWVQREIIAEVIAAAGHEICGSAHSSEEAISMATARPPDVLIADVRLLGSVDAAVAIRAACQCRIIFLGGFMDTETRERMRVAEPSVILVTPVTDTQIIGAVGIATYRPGSLRPSRQAPAPQLLPEPVPAVQVRQS
jgi:DNA-binding NarL/FixJ family response regulator